MFNSFMNLTSNVYNFRYIYINICSIVDIENKNCYQFIKLSEFAWQNLKYINCLDSCL